MANIASIHFGGLIIRQKEPNNLETPLDQVDSYLTPTELFYIRSHFPAPRLELASYQLRIDGAVGNAEWTGVPLAALLERAGLEEGACEIVLEGADRGTPTEQPIPPGPIAYARSVRREKAVEPEVLIAYQMNGRDLSRD